MTHRNLHTQKNTRGFVSKKSMSFILELNNFKQSFKDTVMQIEKALINDCLYVSKVSWKFRIANIYNFAVIYPWNLLFS